MKRPIVVAGVVLGAVAAATVAVAVLFALSAYRHECEVCVEFRGKVQCRQAFGPSEREALETAQQNACAFLAAGMTATVECQNRTPTRTSCRP